MEGTRQKQRNKVDKGVGRESVGFVGEHGPIKKTHGTIKGSPLLFFLRFLITMFKISIPQYKKTGFDDALRRRCIVAANRSPQQ